LHAIKNSCHPQAAQLTDEADGAASFALIAEQLRESLDRMLRIDSQSKAKLASNSKLAAGHSNSNSHSSGDSTIAGSFLRGLQSTSTSDTNTSSTTAFGSSSNANYSNSAVTAAAAAAVTVQVIHVPLHVSVIAGGCFALCGAAAARVFPLQQWQLRQQHAGMYSSNSSSNSVVPSLTSGQLLPEVCCLLH
jgi:hypothetical protein